MVTPAEGIGKGSYIRGEKRKIVTSGEGREVQLHPGEKRSTEVELHPGWKMERVTSGGKEKGNYIRGKRTSYIRGCIRERRIQPEKIK